MKIKFLIFFTIFFLIVFHYRVSGQGVKRIYLPEYNYTLSVSGKSIGSYSDILPDNRKIEIYLFDYKGRMSVKCYDKNLQLLEKGSYINSLCLLKKYINSLTPDKQNIAKQIVSIGVYSYYQPLRDGHWFFFDEKKRLRLKKNYKRGILIDSVIVKD